MQKLTIDQKKHIVQQILKLDPQGRLVNLKPNDSYSGGSISYNTSSGIVLHRIISALTDEEYARAYLVVRLVHELRYPAVCLELEAPYSIGHAQEASKARVDIKVTDKRQFTPASRSTFMLIETKRPDQWDTYNKDIEGQLFNTGNQEYAKGIRYAVWYSVEFAGDEMRDRCIVIDFRKYQDRQKWIDAGEPGLGFDIPVEYGVVTKRRLKKGIPELDLRRNVTGKELTDLSRDFHNQLWGGAKMGDTDVFNNLLKLFLAKIYDEQNTSDGEAYGFQIEAKDGEPESADAVVAKINTLYQNALMLRLDYTEEQAQAQAIDTSRFLPNKVFYAVEKLQTLSIVENTFNEDVLGVFFEKIVRTGFKQDKGQFFTHPYIVRFILHALELDDLALDLLNGSRPRLPYIIDPSCGSGTFILEAMKFITRTVLHTRKSEVRSASIVKTFVNQNFAPHAENKNEHNQWAKDYIFGVEGSNDLAAATKVNMIMHGDGSANIVKGDGLANFPVYSPDSLRITDTDKNAPYKLPVNAQYDCIISNPPFSLKEDQLTLNEYQKRFLYGGMKSSENLFIERWYQLLREGGRLGVVLPDSIFDTNENLYIRLFLYRFFKIRAIVSLPQVTFQPYTPTKTSLLFAVKKTREEVEAWDGAWRQAANEYGKLRGSLVVKHILNNDRVRDGLIDAAVKADVEWYPAQNLLAPNVLPGDIRRRVGEAFSDKPIAAKKYNELLADHDALLAADELNALPDDKASQSRQTLVTLLRDRLPVQADTLTLTQLAETAYDDIVNAAKLNYAADGENKPYTNSWWVFSEVTSRPAHDYDIFFADAHHVGYKRTTRHPEGLPQSNDLFQIDADGNIEINELAPATILDHLRSARIYAL